jgi:predicted flap endonuclease-1-like 5' DNA nuclease
LVTAVVVIALVAAVAIGYFVGRASRREPPVAMSPANDKLDEHDADVPNLDERDAELAHLRGLAEERRGLFATLAKQREETARYRQLCVDLENEAPPPLLGGPGMPDNLKLIVGIGPVLERMLHQLGITTYRQIARWTDRDIDDIEAKLPEFPGRIRRDQWVMQARALHQSTHGETLPARGERP